MERENIIVAGIAGDEVGKELRQALAEGLSLLVCSRATRIVVEEKLACDFSQCWVSFIPLQQSLEKIKEFSISGKVVIITSGDPLFFGFGRTLMNKLPGMKVRFVPAVSSMQLCFSRFSIPWEKASFLSLHGRDIEELLSNLDKDLLFILTDEKNSPACIAAKLQETLTKTQCEHFTAMVGERLGFKDEKLFQGSLAEVAGITFSAPNCLILKKTQQGSTAESRRFGLTENEISHSRGLITKDEVRAAVLHKLNLPGKGVFWDVGAGSGSISIEASRLNPELRIFSVEKNEQEVLNIKYNIDAFGCKNIEVIHGAAPEILSQLPEPDCVFVGGSGGCLEQIIEYLVCNTDCGKVVITAVTEKTAAEAPEFLLKKNFVVKKSTISVTRCTLLPGKKASAEEQTLNTIHVISGEKYYARTC